MKYKNEELEPFFVDNLTIDLTDCEAIHLMLISCAQNREVLTYSSALNKLGHGFTRPKMRLFCRILDQIDSNARVLGHAELAVLVVKKSDQLPGQGWWFGQAQQFKYHGPSTGKDAMKFVHQCQESAFNYYCKMAP